MITILFWNLEKNLSALEHLSCLAQNQDVDIFMLAECPTGVDFVGDQLNMLGLGTFREASNATAKVRAVTKLGRKEFFHRFTSVGKEMAIWSAHAPKLTPNELLLAGVHLPSKAGGASDSDQFSVAKEVIEELADFEERRSHRNTLLVGDFNMHPYDEAMTSVTGVHGLMTRKLAELPDRIHRNRSRRRFYNPMWGLFGDRTPGPAGSYFWTSSHLHNPHWAMFDQLLLRPALIDQIRVLRILDADGIHSLMDSKGAPDRHISDHLPILFRLDI